MLYKKENGQNEIFGFSFYKNLFFENLNVTYLLDNALLLLLTVRNIDDLNKKGDKSNKIKIYKKERRNEKYMKTIKYVRLTKIFLYSLWTFFFLNREQDVQVNLNALNIGAQMRLYKEGEKFVLSLVL